MDDATSTTEPAEPHRYDITNENRQWSNFVWLALHQVLLRVGWIFKTESIIIPFFMDYIGGGPVLRGWLMVLNRLGFSLPPLLFARRLKLSPRKKLSTAWCSFGMAAPFALFALVWWSGWWRDESGAAYRWMPYLFLVGYGVFFCLTGMHQLSAYALQGKLIQHNWHGRLFMAGTIVGAPLAILAAQWLMPAWLATPETGFAGIFAVSAIAFLAAGFIALAPVESADDFSEPATSPWKKLTAVVTAYREDVNFRRVARIAALYSATFMMFPHYQALARQGSGFNLQSLLSWVCWQNAATAAFSLLLGPLADRLGNRAAMRLGVFGSMLPPLLAIYLAQQTRVEAARQFWIVFLLLGLTPVAMKLFVSYTLELSKREHHPLYVSAISTCLAAPVIIGSPLVGMLVRRFGCEPVFAVGAAALFIAGVLTFLLPEPRLNGR
jgi:hypothetical protein